MQAAGIEIIYNSRNFNVVWNRKKDDADVIIYNSRNFNVVWNEQTGARIMDLQQ